MLEALAQCRHGTANDQKIRLNHEPGGHLGHFPCDIERVEHSWEQGSAYDSSNHRSILTKVISALKPRANKNLLTLNR